MRTLFTPLLCLRLFFLLVVLGEVHATVGYSAEGDTPINHESALSVVAHQYDTVIYVKRPPALADDERSIPLQPRAPSQVRSESSVKEFQHISWSNLQLYSQELFGEKWETESVGHMIIGARQFALIPEIGREPKFEGCQLICFRERLPPTLLEIVNRRVTSSKPSGDFRLLTVDIEAGKLYVAVAPTFLFITKESKHAEQFVAGFGEETIAPLDKYFDPAFVQRTSPVWGVRRPLRNFDAEGKEHTNREIVALSASITDRPLKMKVKIAAKDDEAAAAVKKLVLELTELEIAMRPIKNGVAETDIPVGNSQDNQVPANIGSFLFLWLMGFEISP